MQGEGVWARQQGREGAEGWGLADPSCPLELYSSLRHASTAQPFLLSMLCTCNMAPHPTGARANPHPQQLPSLLATEPLPIQPHNNSPPPCLPPRPDPYYKNISNMAGRAYPYPHEPGSGFASKSKSYNVIDPLPEDALEALAHFANYTPGGWVAFQAWGVSKQCGWWMTVCLQSVWWGGWGGGALEVHGREGHVQ